MQPEFKNIGLYAELSRLLPDSLYLIFDLRSHISITDYPDGAFLYFVHQDNVRLLLHVVRYTCNSNFTICMITVGSLVYTQDYIRDITFAGPLY